MSHPTGALAEASSTSTVVLNPPNPARLLESLRDSGYSNDAAVADLVDNCIDAEATLVRIWVDPPKGTLSSNARITIADDGIGMDAAVLCEALKLGSDTERDPTSDLGKYGMGLITASVSIARRLVVYTKTSEGQLLKAVHDLDVIIQRNEFVVEMVAASKADHRFWEQYSISPDRGTIVVLENCDKLSYTNAASFVTRIRKHLGQVFRLFIAAKSKKNGSFTSFITTNDEPIYAVDPLMLEEYSQYLLPQTRELISSFSELVDDIELPVPLDPGNPEAGTDTVRIRIVDLPDDGGALARALDISAANCGIYVMRNQREIAAAQTLQMFQKNFALTRFRAELHLPASLDRRIGINWMKHRIEPDQALLDLLRNRLGPHIASERKKYGRRQSENTAVDHTAYEALISKKAKLLTLPTTKAVEREQAGKARGTVTPKGTTATREGTSDVKQRFRDRCEFREAHMTASGPLWEPDMHGAKIIITFNVDHPLWVRYVLETVDGDTGTQAPIVELLHLFSYCLTTAEFGVFGDDEYLERLINMRQQLSNNMRVLLT
jgi:hypothetical protein